MSETVAYPGKKGYRGAAAVKYKSRKDAKHHAEIKLVERAFDLIPRHHHVLDVPCGAGRVGVHLAKNFYVVTMADYSPDMVELAKVAAKECPSPCQVDRQDIEQLTYPDKSFDTILCFRFFHHLPNAELRAKVIGELTRVSRKFVAISYFDPWSVTTIKRKVFDKLGLRKYKKHATSLNEVRGYFSKNGYRLVKDFAISPIIHTLRLAVFERKA